MSRQKGILPFFRLSRFGGLMHFSYFCLIKNVIHENFIPCETIYQSPYFSWHLVFAYDPPTMGWSSWMPDIDGMVLLKK